MKATIVLNDPYIVSRHVGTVFEHARILLTPEDDFDNHNLKVLVDEHRLGTWAENQPGSVHITPKLMGGGFF